MDGVASISSVGAVASRFQSVAVAPPPEQPTGDVASNALKLIHALLSAGSEAHVLDLKA